MYWAIQDSLKMSFPTTDDQPSTPTKNKDQIISTINLNDQVNYEAPFEEVFDFPDNNTPAININEKPAMLKQNSNTVDDNMNKSMGISHTKTPSTAEYVSNKGNQSNASIDNDNNWYF